MFLALPALAPALQPLHSCTMFFMQSEFTAKVAELQKDNARLKKAPVLFLITKNKVHTPNSPNSTHDSMSA